MSEYTYINERFENCHTTVIDVGTPGLYTTVGPLFISLYITSLPKKSESKFLTLHHLYCFPVRREEYTFRIRAGEKHRIETGQVIKRQTVKQTVKVCYSRHFIKYVHLTTNPSIHFKNPLSR